MRSCGAEPHLSPVGVVVALVLVAACAPASSGRDGPLRVNGSTTVNPIVSDAAETLRGRGLEITVDTQGGSAGGLAQLASGQADVAMVSAPVTPEDEDRYPQVDFVSTLVGEDAVGIVADRRVVDGGVRSLGRDQLRALFEGRVSSWRELGGSDLPVFVYDKEPGRGTREVLDRYLYGEDGSAPPPPDTDRFAIVGGNEETRAKLLSTPGSVGPLSVAFAAGHDDLATISVDGIEATPDNVASGRYPLARPLLLVTDGEPSGAARRLVDYVLSDAGQEIVSRHGFLTLEELGRE